MKVLVVFFFMFCVIGGNAHLRLTNPTPRSSSDNLITSPCGGVGAKTPIQFDVGDSLNVKVGSTDGHSGTLSINLLNTNQQFISTLFTRAANGASSYTMNVILNQQCVGCVLQAVLKTSGITWFSCSDISVNSVNMNDEEFIENEDNMNEDVLDDDEDVLDDDDQKQSTKENKDVLVQYISIITACVVVIITCIVLLIYRRNQQQTQSDEN